MLTWALRSNAVVGPDLCWVTLVFDRRLVFGQRRGLHVKRVPTGAILRDEPDRQGISDVDSDVDPPPPSFQVSALHEPSLPKCGIVVC